MLVSRSRYVTTPSVGSCVLGTVWDFGEACFLRIKACLLEVTHRDHPQTMFINLLAGTD